MANGEDVKSLVEALRVKYFLGGIRKLCREGWEEEFDRWAASLKKELAEICDDDGPGDPGWYYCERVPVPEAGKGCWKKVCYDKKGQVVYEGPVVCP